MTKFIFYVLIAVILILSTTVIYSINTIFAKVNKDDLIIIHDKLTDDPERTTIGGRNSVSVISFNLDKFHGRDFTTREEYFDTRYLDHLTSHLKSRDSVTIAFLKHDYYPFLKSLNQDWERVYGLGFYKLKSKNVDYIQLEQINSKNSKGGIITLYGSLFFLFISVLGFIELKKALYPSKKS